jgi:hypothetical protein
MTDQQVQLFLADLAIIILLARLLGIAAKRLGQPPVLARSLPASCWGRPCFTARSRRRCSRSR